MKPNQRLVHIEWVDSSGMDVVWTHLKDYPKLNCISIGWVFDETDEYIRIYSHWSDEGCVSGVMVIPKQAIVKIEDIVFE